MGGKRSQYIGAQFERFVEDELAFEYRQGRACVKKMRPPMRVRHKVKGNNKQFVCEHTHAPTVDYEGVINGGVSVKFDAKLTEDDKKFSFNAIGDKQIAHLAEHARFGGVSFLYVAKAPQGFARERYVLPVDANGRIAGIVHRRCERLLIMGKQRASIKWEEIPERYRVQGKHESWLDVLIRLEEEGEE